MKAFTSVHFVSFQILDFGFDRLGADQSEVSLHLCSTLFSCNIKEMDHVIIVCLFFLVILTLF